MTARGVATGRESGRLGMAAEVAFVAANFAIIALLVSPKTLLPFFAVCSLFIFLRSHVAGLPRAMVQVSGVVVVTFLLLYLKRSDLLFNDLVSRWVAAIIPVNLAKPSAELAGAFGISYALLRFVYALFDTDVTPWQFLRYYFFLPTFFSGPIMAPADLLKQSPSLTRVNLVEGAARVMFGGVKFGVSSILQLFVPLAHPVQLHLALESQSRGALWIGLFLCGVWLYLNFSAFTDIAVGIGRMMGIRVPENFRNPFGATNITDFWRRWHITLGDWLRVHVFNSLTRGLSRHIPARSLVLAIVPTLATMVVCGLWHQTTWAYVAWGAMHGAGLVTHQLWRRYVVLLVGADCLYGRSYRIISWALTQSFISLSWAFFFPLAHPGFEPTFALHMRYLKRVLFF